MATWAPMDFVRNLSYIRVQPKSAIRSLSASRRQAGQQGAADPAALPGGPPPLSALELSNRTARGHAPSRASGLTQHVRRRAKAAIGWFLKSARSTINGFNTRRQRDTAPMVLFNARRTVTVRAPREAPVAAAARTPVSPAARPLGSSRDAAR